MQINEEDYKKVGEAESYASRKTYDNIFNALLFP